MRRNIELKARCRDLDAARRVAQAIGAVLLANERQHDTYFSVQQRRLKLRRRWIDRIAQPSELIAYARTDEARPRGSNYAIVTTDQGDALCAVLRNALGALVEVIKERSVYLRDNVRIHLDQVEGLGTFIEFEAIVDETCTDTEGEAKVAHLCGAFGIAAADIERGSYADLLRR